MWLNSLNLLITVTAVPTMPTNASGVGSLSVSVLPSGALTSLDGTSTPSNSSTVVTAGSWGDVVCDGGVVVYSHSSLAVAFEPPPTAAYAPSAYTIHVSTSRAFPAEPSTRAVLVTPGGSLAATVALPAPWLPSALRYVVNELAPDTGYYLRVGVSPPSLPVEVSTVLPRPVPVVFSALGEVGTGCACASLRESLPCVATPSLNASAFTPHRPVIGKLRSVCVAVLHYACLEQSCLCAALRCKFSLCVYPLVRRALQTASVTTPVLALPTLGGATFDITGTGLGLTPTAVSVTYVGGSVGMARWSHTVPPGTCTIVSAGTALRCPSLPGVGANYTFTVTVDGGVSNASASTLSYAPPVINSLSGEGATGADTAGGAIIVLRGANFGPVNGTTVTAWATPVADDFLVFPGHDCVVVEPHVAIRCVITPGMGAALSWRVVVEGQANSMPLASYGPPVLHRVEFAEAGVSLGDTQGGSPVSIEGRNLGNDVRYVAVTVSTLAGATPVSGCALATNHTALTCPLPPGVGVISLVTVTVLGQTATLAPVGLAYAPPAVARVSPSAWSTDLAGVSVTVTGRGFGPPALARLVDVTVTGAACDGAQPVTMAIQDVTVRSDTLMSLTFGAAPGPVIASWAMRIVVAGQAIATGSWNVTTTPPSVAGLSLDRPFNGTHYFLLLSGNDFGPNAGPGTCPGDATLTVDGAPCNALSMPRVRDA
jgi:hypothetical protein